MEMVQRDLEVERSGSPNDRKSSSTSKESSTRLSEAQLKMFQEAYNLFDKNQDGGITMNEFGEVMHALGVVLSASDLVEMFEKVDTDGSGLIEFDEFLHIMKAQFENPPQDEQGKLNDPVERWRDAFKLFDLDSDGFITVEELGTVLSSMGENLTNAELEEMIAAVDKDNDGKLTLEEFAHVMEHGITIDPEHKQHSAHNNNLNLNLNLNLAQATD